jgi:hypothetical protein
VYVKPHFEWKCAMAAVKVPSLNACRFGWQAHWASDKSKRPQRILDAISLAWAINSTILQFQRSWLAVSEAQQSDCHRHRRQRLENQALDIGLL